MAFPIYPKLVTDDGDSHVFDYIGKTIYIELSKLGIRPHITMDRGNAIKLYEDDQNGFCGGVRCNHCPLYLTNEVGECISIYYKLRDLYHQQTLAEYPELFL
jgi:hypothetical protein